MCCEKLCTDIPEAGHLLGAHQEPPGGLELPLPPLQQGLSLPLWSGHPPVFPQSAASAQSQEGHGRLQVRQQGEQWLPVCAWKKTTKALRLEAWICWYHQGKHLKCIFKCIWESNECCVFCSSSETIFDGAVYVTWYQPLWVENVLRITFFVLQVFKFQG